jgi:hypothetical protein
LLGSGYDGTQSTDWVVLLNNIISGSGATYASASTTGSREIFKDKDTINNGTRHYSSYPLPELPIWIKLNLGGDTQQVKSVGGIWLEITVIFTYGWTCHISTIQQRWRRNTQA